jgi:hypothetical protein
MTVGELREVLEGLDDDAAITLEGPQPVHLAGMVRTATTLVLYVAATADPAGID